MQRTKRRFWASVFAPIVLVAALVAAWAIDTAVSAAEVVRNVELAGEPVGSLAEDALVDRVEDIAADLQDRPVRIVTPEASYETDAGHIGLDVDVAATVDGVLDVGRDSALVTQPWRWASSFVSPRQADLVFTVDRQQARSALHELQGASRLTPSEPTIVSTAGRPFEAVPGEPASGIDPDVLADALTEAAGDAQAAGTVEVQVETRPIPPSMPDEAAEAAARTANRLTDDALEIRAGGATAVADPALLRSWITTVPAEERLEVGLQPEPVLEWLASAFAAIESAPRNASFQVESGEVILRPSRPGVRCCPLDSPDVVEDALRSGQPSVDLELLTEDAELTTAEAEALGIVTEVGQPSAFGPTTRYACCQNRVQNIHRIADTVRGVVLEPGETFSVNDFVGRRTREKGYLPAGAIADGETTDEVGGGISQFATSLFNAALFAGLDFGEYQSHSLYFPRYPRGHEATVSFPAPDLEIENTSPYGVLLWPTYTDTSITVHLYSSPWAAVSLGRPQPTPQGNCTRWTTERTRSFVDGTTDQDSVFAVYRPAEGVDC